jgi:thioredoxin reductase (NADPH)
VTEAVLYRDLQVGVVGGGNSAGQAAVYLARFAQRVVLMVRTPELSAMSQYLIDQIAAIPNIEVRYRTQVTACVAGEGHLASATLTCEQDGAEPTSETLPLSALFVFIGQQPRTAWLPDDIGRDDAGFISTGPAVLVDGRRPDGWPDRDPFLLESSLPGVFAAGDVRAQSVKRIASAVGEGSMAIQFVHQYRATL